MQPSRQLYGVIFLVLFCAVTAEQSCHATADQAAGAIQVPAKELAATVPSGSKQPVAADSSIASMSLTQLLAQPLTEKPASASGLEIPKTLQERKKNGFYEQYLQVYFPRACVIREWLFAHMTPHEIDEALQALVLVLSEKPWFYFENDPDRIKIGTRWEVVIDQCSLIHEFLKKAKVARYLKMVYLSEPLKSGFASHLVYSVADARMLGPSVSLIQYLKEQNSPGFQDFYAMIFDYCVKLFNEGILFKDNKQARYYLEQLEKLMIRLTGTRYERKYQEALKTCQDLQKMLQGEVLHDDDYGREDGDF